MTSRDPSACSFENQRPICDFSQVEPIDSTQYFDVSSLLYSFCTVNLILNEQLFGFLSTLPIPAGVKGLDSRHIFCNERYLEISNINNNYAYFGKSDGDLPTNFSHFQNEFYQQDQLVIESKQPIHILDIHPYGKDQLIKPLLFHKYPCFNPDNICVGTVYVGEDVSKRLIVADNIRKYLLNERQSTNTVLIGKPTELLSETEWEVVYLLTNGSTLKEISVLLDKGYSTIRTHQQNSISKLNSFGVYNSKQLKEFVLDLGWKQHIPSSLLVPKSIIISA